MHTYLEEIQNFLYKMATEEVDIPESLIEEFGERCKNALRKRFQEKNDKFTIRMSNIGKPLGQLQREMAGVETAPPSYTIPMKFLFGDLIEAAAVVIMKAAGINIQSENVAVSLPIGGIELEGEYDLEIDSGLWDIKSTSPWSFNNKFQGFLGVAKNDAFGYITQGYLYSEAAEKPFCGWIVINKATGEWKFVDTPLADERYKSIALKEADRKIRILTDPNSPFECCCEPEEETYYRKKTGNKVLPITGQYCPFKFSCYPGCKYLPRQASKGSNPGYVWYTEVHERESSE